MLRIALVAAATIALATSADAAQEKVLCQFHGGQNDGRGPGGTLTLIGDELYGMTLFDGGGYGTIFTARKTGGRHRIVHSFGGADGEYPYFGGFINQNGVLYGLTFGGGVTGCHNNLGCGVIFSLTSGTEMVDSTFHSGSNGANPGGSLINVDGVFYGTTEYGGLTTCSAKGANECGTVFSYTPGGAATTLYQFRGKQGGANPMTGLTYVDRTFYGVTYDGGAKDSGTVFSLSKLGKEKVLHSFTGGADGANPQAALLYLNGTLYGTTSRGGVGNAGTVFSITPGGTFNLLHGFTGGNDGGAPYTGLTDVNGVLYGTTTGDFQGGQGTAYSITTGGVETVLHNFLGGEDGLMPAANLIYDNGTFYGTTLEGGGTGCSGNGNGCGTVFSITP